MKTKIIINSVLTSILLTSIASFASDHDDGVSGLKPASRNLTDLYVFREDGQTGISTDKKNIILVMNSNPRSPAGMSRYFSTAATYEFHISDVNGKDTTPSGIEDKLIQFKFGPPDVQTDAQPFVMSIIKSGKTTFTTSAMKTTPINESSKDLLTINHVDMDGAGIDVFAGLREDPFFFDVEQFFKVRAGAIGVGPKVGFRSPDKAVDFTIGYNVNTIVVKIPISALVSSSTQTVFDVWETVTLLNGTQVERLARPAINEGLIITNDFLNAFNMIPPSADLSSAAAPVLAEAAKSITAFDDLDGKSDITVGQIVAAFLPDVMRIDTSVAIPLSKAAYNADASIGKGILTGGRKLEDDVMDITISFLVAGDATGTLVKDNVSYAGTPGNPNQGHKYLYKQTTRLGAASFPFLARPN